MSSESKPQGALDVCRWSLVSIFQLIELGMVLFTIVILFDEEYEQKAEEASISSHIYRLWIASAFIDAFLLFFEVCGYGFIMAINCASFCRKIPLRSLFNDESFNRLDTVNASSAQCIHLIRFWAMIIEGSFWITLSFSGDMRVFYILRYVVFAVHFFLTTFSKKKSEFDPNDFYQNLVNIANAASSYTIYFLHNDGSGLYQALLGFVIWQHFVAPCMTLCSSAHLVKMIVITPKFPDNFKGERKVKAEAWVADKMNILRTDSEYLLDWEFSIFKIFFGFFVEAPLTVIKIFIAVNEEGNAVLLSLIPSFLSLGLLAVDFFKLLQNRPNYDAPPLEEIQTLELQEKDSDDESKDEDSEEEDKADKSEESEGDE